MVQINETLGSILQKNITQILSVLMLALATYITYRLAPVAQDIAVLKQNQVVLAQEINDLQKSTVNQGEFAELNGRIADLITLLKK